MAREVPRCRSGSASKRRMGACGASGLPALPVVDAGGRLVGLLTMDNITDLILVAAGGVARPPARKTGRVRQVGPPSGLERDFPPR